MLGLHRANVAEPARTCYALPARENFVSGDLVESVVALLGEFEQDLR